MFYSYLSCNGNVDTSFSLGYATLKGEQMFVDSTASNIGQWPRQCLEKKKKNQNTLIFKTTASTSNNGWLLQHLLSFHNLVIAKAYG